MRVRALVVCLLGLMAVEEAASQDLAERFRNARLRRIAVEMANRTGVRLTPRPLAHLATRSDTLAAWMNSRRPDFGIPEVIEEPPPPEFTISGVRVYRRLERPVFQNRYGDTRWAFMQGRRLAEIDTTLTTDIRARLQAHYGAPTYTVAEMDSLERHLAEDIIQFEYWMVVNDSIPIMVIDVDGPLSRGVVVATDSRYRDQLDGVRYALLSPLFAEERRAPYIDYFYLPAISAWYVSGFDGATFFHQRIARPNLMLGRPVMGAYVSPSEDR
ncbi:MAG: hypothetical protein HKN29_06565 [Rhodothermales bacterium]|nr:hypothetical protein [Rhodothermales bacterium]